MEQYKRAFHEAKVVLTEARANWPRFEQYELAIRDYIEQEHPVGDAYTILRTAYNAVRTRNPKYYPADEFEDVVFD